MNPKTSLHIVLILSFIGSGFSFISYMTAGLFYTYFQQTLAAFSQTMGDELSLAIEALSEIPRLLYISMGLFYGISLLGAVWMWRLRKSGFHFYTLSQLVVLALPVLFMGKAAFAVGDAMLTLLFVAYYYFTLRRLGIFSQGDAA